MPKGLVACTLASSLGLEEISLVNYVRDPAAAGVRNLMYVGYVQYLLGVTSHYIHISLYHFTEVHALVPSDPTFR
jgi:hypothetical protein